MVGLECGKVLQTSRSRTFRVRLKEGKGGLGKIGINRGGDEERPRGSSEESVRRWRGKDGKQDSFRRSVWRTREGS